MATVKKNNIASIKSHEKANFEIIDDEKMKHLRTIGSLNNDEVRFEKKF
jgi:hypothetical protein